MSDKPALTQYAKRSRLSQAVEELAKVTDPADRRIARSALKEEELLLRRQGSRFQTAARLADAVAKFGGGSLLTATLLLIIGGKTGSAIVATAALALMLFVAGTIFWAYCDLRTSQREFDAEWLAAVLEEAER